MEKSFFGRVLGLVIWLLLLVPAISQVQEVQFDANETTQILCPLIPRSQLSQRVKVTPSPTSPSGEFVYPDESEIFMFSLDGGSLTFFATDTQSLTRGRLQLSFIAINGGGTTFLFIDYAPPGIYPNSARFEVSSDFKPVAQIYSSESSVQVCDAVSKMRLDDFTARVREDPSCPSISGSRGLVDVMSSGITQEHLVFLGIGNCGSGMGPCSCEGFTRSPNITLIPEPPTTTTEFTTTEGTVDTTTQQVDEPTNIAAIVVPVVIVGGIIISIIVALVIGIYVRNRNCLPGHGRQPQVEDTSTDDDETEPEQMNGGFHHNEEIDGGNGKCFVYAPNRKEMYQKIGGALAELQGLTLCMNGLNSNDPSQPVMNGVRDGPCLVYNMLNGSAEHQNGIDPRPANQRLQTLISRSIDDQYTRRVVFVHFSKPKDRLLEMNPSHVKHIAIQANPEEGNVDPTGIASDILREQQRSVDTSVVVQDHLSQSDPPPPYASNGTSAPSLPVIDSLRNEHAVPASSQSSPALTADRSDSSLQQLSSLIGAKFDAMKSDIQAARQDIKTDVQAARQDIKTDVQAVGENVQAAREDIQNMDENMQQEFEDARKDVEAVGNSVEEIRLRDGVDNQEPENT